MTDIRAVNPLEHADWDSLLPAAPSVTFFHTSAWARVLAESYGYTPVYFAGMDDGRLKALVPFMDIRSPLTGRRGASLPFTDLCEPFVDEEIQPTEVFDRITAFAGERKWKYAEIRGWNGFFKEMPPFASYYHHVLSFPGGEDGIFAGFKESTRRNVRKAVKSGVAFRISNSYDSVEEFYRLHSSTRKRHGVPPQPLRFFKKVFEHIIDRSRGFVALSLFEEKVIAAAVFFWAGEQAIFKYGASDRRYSHLRPNDLLFSESLKRLHRKGIRLLSFGRTDTDNQGLRRFKLGFGTKEETIRYYRYDVKGGSFIARPHGTFFPGRLLGLLPVPILRVIGSALYRHMG